MEEERRERERLGEESGTLCVYSLPLSAYIHLSNQPKQPTHQHNEEQRFHTILQTYAALIVIFTRY